MDKIQTILTAVSSILGILLTVIVPLAIKAYLAFKRGKTMITQASVEQVNAKDAEKNALNLLDMTKRANEIIEELERKFAKQNSILKQVDPSHTLGAIKKECALAQLSEFAIAIGAEFNRDYWSQQIDSIIELTRNVNQRIA